MLCALLMVLPHAAIADDRAGAPQHDPELKHFLAALGLAHHLPKFTTHEVPYELAMRMNEADLKEIGIHQWGARRRIVESAQAAKLLGRRGGHKRKGSAAKGASAVAVPLPVISGAPVAVMGLPAIPTQAVPHDFPAAVNQAVPHDLVAADNVMRHGG